MIRKNAAFLLLFLCLIYQAGSCQQQFSPVLYRVSATPPTVQASGLDAINISDTQAELTWSSNGSGRFSLAIIRLTSGVVAYPHDNTSYTANPAYSSGSDVGFSNYVVFSGSGNSVLITGLTASTQYTAYVYAFNKVANGTEKYNLTTAVDNPIEFTTLPPQIAPTTQASSLVFAGDRRLSMTRGNGGFVLVVAHLGGAVDSHPVDNTTYTAGPYPSGTQIGTGNYVVYNGLASEMDVSNLTYGTSFGIRAYEYNLASGNPKYNTNTATGNPITANTPAVQAWYSYKDTPPAFQSRREPYNLSTVSREFSQFYPIGDHVSSTTHYVYFIAEGDGDVERGVDRSVVVSRDLDDDPTVKSNWVKASPPDANGDTPSFLDRAILAHPLWTVSTTYADGDRVRISNGQTYESLVNDNVGNSPASSPSQWQNFTYWNAYQNWGLMSVVDAGGGTHYGYYVANSGSAQRYSVGMMTSTDGGDTWSQYVSNPIISQSATLSAFYVKVLKDGSDWWMFIQNYVPAFLVESHLLCLEIWHSSNGISWTKQTTVDQLSGRGYAGAVDISQPWKDGGKYYAYISPNEVGQNGGYNAKAEGQTQFLTTYPVGNKILLISWDDWSDFKDGHIVEREIYRTSQQTEIELRTWCQRRSFAGDDFFVSMGFLWPGQTGLNGINQMEPKNDGKVISRSENLTGAYKWGSEVYPNYVLIAKPHQSHVNDVLGSTPNPFNVTTNASGTVVGSPRSARLNTIQPVDNGFVTFSNADFTYDPEELAVSVIIGENALSSTYGIAGMDTDVGGGEHGWHIRKSGQYTFEVWIYSDDNTHYKRYRANIPSNKSNNDATLLNRIGFIWSGGVLRLTVDYNLDCAVTKLVDDVFTTMNVTNEPLRIGAIYPTTNDELWSQDVVGPLLMLSGAGNVTDTNFLYNNLTGY